MSMKDLVLKSKHLFKDFWPLLIIILAVVGFFWKVVFKGMVPLPADFVVGAYYPWLDYKWGFVTGVPVKNPLTTDVVSFTYPMQTLATDMLKKGTLPLWNPYILAGTPLLANFQSAPFSATNFIYFLTDKISAWSIQVILQHFLAALFTFFLLRYWKVSKIGSALGGIVYAFSGFNLIWSQWNGHTLAAAFIPLIILFTDRWLRSSRWIDGFAISVSFALLFLSGYPQIALYLALAIVVLWSIRVWKAKNWFKSSLFLALFLLLGIGISSFQIIPGWELLQNSQRTVEFHPFEWAFLPWNKIVTFFAPDFFGNHSTRNYWGPQDYTSNTGFVGVVAFALALSATAFIRNKKEIKFAVALFILSLVFSFPTPISVFLWKSAIFGLNAASAHRALVLFNFSTALLAGFGTDFFLKKGVKLKLSFFLPFVVLFGFTSYALLLSKNPVFVGSVPKHIVALRNLIFPWAVFTSSIFVMWFSRKLNKKEIGIFILFFIMVFELYRFGWKFTPFSPRSIVFPTTPVLEFLTSQEKPVRVTGSQVIPINMRMPYRLESLEGYDAVYQFRISQFLAALSGKVSGTTPLGRYGTVDNITSPLLDLVNTKYYLAIKKDAKGEPSEEGVISDIFDKKRFKEAFQDKTVVVLESKDTRPRAFMVYKWEKEDSSEKILDKLLDSSFNYGDKIILEVEIAQPNEIPETRGTVTYKTYSENESSLDVETDTEGMLFVSDTYYPGWKAFVNGSETPIYRADFAFRAIKVPKGSHEVKFEYRPDSFFKGLYISLISLLFLIGLYPITKLVSGRKT